MPKEKDPNEPIKVTDRRMFTSEGEVKDEFRDHLSTAAKDSGAHQTAAPAVKPAAAVEPPAAAPGPEPKKRMRDRAEDPGTAFSKFAQSLIIQAYMSLGLLPNRYQPGAEPDQAAAKELIDILTMLAEKTAGNLSEDEDDFLKTHLGELKLAFVRSRTP